MLFFIFSDLFFCHLVRYILTWIYISDCAFALLEKEVVNHPMSHEMFVFSVFSLKM